VDQSSLDDSVVAGGDVVDYVQLDYSGEVAAGNIK
jgi:hypothetical protein